MFRIALAVILLALFPLRAQAYGVNLAYCDTDTKVHETLLLNGLFLRSYGLTDYGFMIVMWAGEGQFVMTAEAEGVACVLTQGGYLYEIKEHNI